MNINSLLIAAARHEWLISPEFFLAHMPFVSNLFNKNIAFEQTDLPSVFAYNNNVKTEISLAAFNTNPPRQPANIEPDSTLVIPVFGAMLKHPGACNYGMTDVENMLFFAATNQNVSAVILNFDSGGGEASAVPPLISGIAAVQNAGKPIVAFADTAASAAYWAAAKTDRIFASNEISATFGSIGAMAQFVDVIPYMEAQGYKVHTIYPPESSEKNKAFRLALDGKYDLIIDEILSPLASKFVADMKTLRKFSVADDHPVFKGKSFNATESLKIGLIDQIGAFSDVLSYISSRKATPPKRSASKTKLSISSVNPSVSIY